MQKSDFTIFFVPYVVPENRVYTEIGYIYPMRWVLIPSHLGAIVHLPATIMAIFTGSIASACAQHATQDGMLLAPPHFASMQVTREARAASSAVSTAAAARAEFAFN